MTTSGDVSQPPFQVAVIGSGPSGIYTALALTKRGPDVHVDVFDKLPAPFGLVRYGVAPDHAKMKTVARQLAKAFTAGRVRFLGNIEIGTDLSLEDLRSHYHAVVYATGCAHDRPLGVPGDDLPGSLGSADVVGWYSAHPDYHHAAPDLTSAHVAVIGGGNVALDIARVLSKPAEAFRSTDVPDPVIDALAQSTVTDVHVIIRRGPAEAQFTPAELLQVTSLDGVSLVLHDDGALAKVNTEGLTRQQATNVDILRKLAPSAGDKRIHFHFYRSPVELRGADKVESLLLERNEPNGRGGVSGTGVHESIDVGLVVRAIGYRSLPLKYLPFDEASGTVPNIRGRVLDSGTVVPGTYLSGWIKRGPSGVIGTNMADANETVASLMEDRPTLTAPSSDGPEAVLALLQSRSVDYVDWDGWSVLDAVELELGQPRGAERVKLPGREAMLHAIRGTLLN